MDFKLFDTKQSYQQSPQLFQYDLKSVDHLYQDYQALIRSKKEKDKLETKEVIAYLDVIYSILKYRNYFSPYYCNISLKELENYSKKNPGRMVEVNFESLVKYFITTSLSPQNDSYISQIKDQEVLFIPKKYRFRETFQEDDKSTFYSSVHTIASENSLESENLTLGEYISGKQFFYAFNQQESFKLSGINYYELFEMKNIEAFSTLNEQIKKYAGKDSIVEGRLTDKDKKGYFFFNADQNYTAKQKMIYYFQFTKLLSQALYNLFAQSQIRIRLMEEMPQDQTIQLLVDKIEDCSDQELIKEFDSYFEAIYASHERPTFKYDKLMEAIERVIQIDPQLDVQFYQDRLNEVKKQMSKTAFTGINSAIIEKQDNDQDAFFSKLAYFTIHFGKNYFLDGLRNSYEWNAKRNDLERFYPLFSNILNNYIVKSLKNKKKFNYEKFENLDDYISQKRMNRIYRRFISDAKLNRKPEKPGDLVINQGFKCYTNVMNSLINSTEPEEAKKCYLELILNILEENIKELREESKPVKQLMIIKRQLIRLYYVLITREDQYAYNNKEYKQLFRDHPINCRELLKKMSQMPTMEDYYAYFDLIREMADGNQKKVTEKQFEDNFGRIKDATIDAAMRKTNADEALRRYYMYLDEHIVDSSTREINTVEYKEVREDDD